MSAGLAVKTSGRARRQGGAARRRPRRSRPARSRRCWAPTAPARAASSSPSPARCRRLGVRSSSTASPGRPAAGEGAARGVAAVPEGHHVLADLTVEDNLKVAGSHLKRAEAAPAIAARARRCFPNCASACSLRARLSFRRPAADGRARAGDRGQAALSARRRIVLRPRSGHRRAARARAAEARVAGRRRAADRAVHSYRAEDRRHAYVMERGRISFRGEAKELVDNPGILHSAYLG